MIFWILLIGVFGAICYAVYEEYEKAKYCGEEAVQSFKKTLAIVVVIVAVLFVGIVKYMQTNKRHGSYHDQNGREQIQYQGSQEQQKDLRDIDKYSDSHSDF